MYLLPLSWVYGAIVGIRNWCYDVGVFRVTHLSVPVVSVGNISAGGTGKTPFVEMLVRRLMAGKHRVAVVSRGYGRRSRGFIVASNGRQRCSLPELAGDEATMLAQKLDGVVVAVDERRARGASRVVRDFDVKSVVLDDGFQHRSLHRDVDIVLMTAEEAVEGDSLLPAGNRRESIGALRRADLVVVTRCDGKDSFERTAEILRKDWPVRIMGVKTGIDAVRSAGSGKRVDTKKFRGTKVLAFSAIGNPSSYEQTLTHLGVRIVDHMVFPDHHWYTARDIGKILDRVHALGPDAIFTTEKDLARLEGQFQETFLKRYAVYVVEIKLVPIAGGRELDRVLQTLSLVA